MKRFFGGGKANAKDSLPKMPPQPPPPTREDTTVNPPSPETCAAALDALNRLRGGADITIQDVLKRLAPRSIRSSEALDEAEARFDRAHSKTADGALTVNRTLLPLMLDFASRFHEFFPKPLEVAQVGVERSWVYTRSQCLSILSCSFLCLFPRSSHARVLPSINYDEMHCAAYYSSRNSVEVAKELMVFEYFLEMSRRTSSPDGRAELDRQRLMIRRQHATSLPEELMALPLRPILMGGDRESIDEQQTELRVDFANMVIGGAANSFGCVQEEIMFSLCPEMIVTRLQHPPMDDTEAILMVGFEQFANIKPGTYAFSMEYGGPHAHRADLSMSYVTAIDACDYRNADFTHQYTAPAIRREVMKCFAGVNVQGPNAPRIVATGNWGCGAFQGDAQIKALEQWIACSMAQKRLHYFPFAEKKVAMLQQLSEYVVSTGITCRQLFYFLTHVLKPGSSKTVFTQLERWLAQQPAKPVDDTVLTSPTRGGGGSGGGSHGGDDTTLVGRSRTSYE